MPETGPPRFCVFGDSHYACLKQAETAGLVDASGVELEYWGHVGGRFLFLEAREGAVHPTDDFTARRFAKFNARGRTFLPAADFDCILVMGARCYSVGMFQMLARAACHGPFVSAGLRRRILADGLHRQLGYRLAQGLAASGTARVLLAPTSFPTLGHETGRAMTPEMMALGPEFRAEVWEAAIAAAAEDGITLIPQPDQTVAAGLFTAPEFAVDNHLQKQDFAHRNAAYGALILDHALAVARTCPRRA
jgi:hypothetical protein